MAEAVVAGEYYQLVVPGSPAPWLKPLADRVGRYRTGIVRAESVGHTVAPDNDPIPGLLGLFLNWQEWIDHHNEQMMKTLTPLREDRFGSLSEEDRLRRIRRLENKLIVVPEKLPEGVVVHLERKKHVRAKIDLDPAQAISLGLDPSVQYFVQSLVEVKTEDDLDLEFATVTESNDFLIPTRWLKPIKVDEHALRMLLMDEWSTPHREHGQDD